MKFLTCSLLLMALVSGCGKSDHTATVKVEYPQSSLIVMKPHEITVGMPATMTIPQMQLANTFVTNRLLQDTHEEQLRIEERQIIRHDRYTFCTTLFCAVCLMITIITWILRP